MNLNFNRRVSMYLILILIFLSRFTLLQAGDLDSLTSYYPHCGIVFYKAPNIEMQASRFEIDVPIRIKSIQVRLSGSSEKGTALVHIYGHEAGASVPILEKDLIPPVTINKTNAGFQYFNIKLEKELVVKNNQFFIALDQMSDNVFLCSDKNAKIFSCKSNIGELYGYQLLKSKDGKWKYGKYGYDVTVQFEYIDEKKTNFFAEDVQDSTLIDASVNNLNLSLADINKDGFIDIIVDGNWFFNTGNGKFDHVNKKFGVDGKPILNIIMDINCDGNYDILHLGIEKDNKKRNYLYLSDGYGKFIRQNIQFPKLSTPQSYSIADLNGDLYPDIYITQGEDEANNNNYLLINNKDNGFYDASQKINSLSKNSRSCKIIDYDNDGDSDVFVVNKLEANELWENHGSLVFKNVINHRFVYDAENVVNDSKKNETLYKALRYGNGVDWIDIDNDGDLDLILPSLLSLNKASELEKTRTSLFLNSGKPDFNFEKIDRSNNIELEEKHTNVQWADINNDGISDCYISSNCDCRYGDLYLQNNYGFFVLKTYDSGLDKKNISDQFLFADINNDGKQDIVCIENSQLKIYTNTTNNNNNFISFNFGNFSKTNKSKLNLIGTTVKIHTKKGTYYQELSVGSGLLVQKPSRLHFGLGTEKKVDSVEITYPFNKSNPIVYYNPLINQIHTCEELTQRNLRSDAIVHKIYPNPVKTHVNISYEITSPAHVQISIVNINGQLIKQLKNRRQPAGKYTVEWDCKDSNQQTVSVGSYIYRIKAGNNEVHGRIVLVK